MKVELEIITKQLTEACGLPNTNMVAGCFDDDGKLCGWTIVDYNKETGEIKISKEFPNNIFATIKELIENMKEIKKQ